MRDPQAKLVFGEDLVFRNLFKVLTEDHPLHTHAQNWVNKGLLMPFAWQTEYQLVSPKIPFVSSPEEWCDAQLFAAARLTLDLLEEVNSVRADLKDASAWNVIFVGCKPIFCDLTSLELIQTNHWWGAGQFVRHFIGPLWLSRETGFKSNEIFRMNRDGAMPDLVRNTLGWRRFLCRCWPLVADAKGQTMSAEARLVTQKTPRYRQELVASLRWMLSGVQPRGIRNTTWGQYTEERCHYSEDMLNFKRKQVSLWLKDLKPDWTLDLGCNSGEFSQLALDAGSCVIAVDGDCDAVQAMYLQHAGNPNLYPVLASLDDIHSGRGWAGVEHTGLAERLKGSADMVLMLALIHHLGISAAVHLTQVAHFAATCTRRWIVVEWLEPTDPQVLKLCDQHSRNISEFAVKVQRQAFINAGFVLRQEVNLPGGLRHLALLEKEN